MQDLQLALDVREPTPANGRPRDAPPVGRLDPQGHLRDLGYPRRHLLRLIQHQPPPGHGQQRRDRDRVPLGLPQTALAGFEVDLRGQREGT